MARFERIPLGGLDLRTPDHLAPAGTLRTCENLCYQGPQDAPWFAPVAPAAEIEPETALSGDIQAIGKQVRQRRGDLSSQADSGLERWVVMTDRYIYLIDPDNANRTTEVYDFGDTDSTRKAQFAAVGVAMLIAVSSGSGVGEPEALLYLEDDICVPYAVPIPDAMDESTAQRAGDQYEKPGLLPGIYGVRYAYKMKDGSVGPASPPHLIDISTGIIGTADATLSDDVSAGDTEFRTSGSSMYILWSGLQRDAAEDATTGWDAKAIDVDGELVRVQSVVYSSSESKTIFTLEPGTQFGSAHSSGDDIEWIRPFVFTFSVSGTLTLPDSDYDELIKSIVVLLTPPLDREEEGVFDSPYYQVAEITGLDNGDEIVWQDDTVAISGYPAYEEGQLTAHEIFAASCFSYNSRLILGDVSYDFRLPDVSITNTGGSVTVQVGVLIETQNGTFERIGPEIDSLLSADIVIEDGLLAYPDRRVKEWRFYLDDTGTMKLAGTVKAQPAPSGANLSYAFVENPVELVATATVMPTVATVNAILDHDVNRVLYSETFRVFDLPAKNSQYIGLDDDDVVLGFAAAGESIDTGQFGEYPLYVLCKDSLHAAQIGTSPFILGIAPVETNVGAFGRYAFANVGGVVAVATRQGIGVLNPRLSEPLISAPLHTQASSGFLDLLDEDTALGYFVDPERDRRELWVATASDVYAFSLKHGRWFTLDRARVAFSRSPGGLVGADADGLLQDELAGPGESAVTMVLAPLHMDAVGTLKRFRTIGLRASGDWDPLHLAMAETSEYDITATLVDQDIDNTDLRARTVHLSAGLLVAPVVTITGMAGAETRIESLEVGYNLHAPHRIRVF